MEISAAQFNRIATRGHGTRQLALDFGFIPEDPPLTTRLEPSSYSKAWCPRPDEIE
jgi:hypothetical protein